MIDKPHTSPNRTEIPPLDTQTANQLLGNVFDACDMQPSSIPVEVLESWGNYKKPPVDFGKTFSYLFLILIILLPLMFFHPSVSARRINIDASNDAVYQISVQTLLPVRSVHASLNGTPISLEKISSREYTASLSENGTLSVTATTFNGQSTEQTYEVTHIDTEKPQLIQSYSQNGVIYLVVRDTYSGVDYEGITGLTPESVDEETGTIGFQIPQTPQTVTIPDHAGNELTLLISPVDVQ